MKNGLPSVLRLTISASPRASATGARSERATISATASEDSGPSGNVSTTFFARRNALCRFRSVGTSLTSPPRSAASTIT
ncbi:hypothetical protein [Sorangium sp. So ce124]|uniref:hypothetical protein n=1 Tax=Sorangium sp. So ce124 TaxID=3133280 RepID=UPI003F6428B2